MSDILLNVADIQRRSRVNGPGVRSVVWVQGCTIGCPGCFNPHTHAHEKRHLIDPRQLGRDLARLPGTDGITLSGGEPFEQAAACTVLAETIRSAGHSVMAFTGYRFDVLRKCPTPAVQRLLGTIDLLVAGPYVADLEGDGALWRGSTNQTVHALTDRLAAAIDTDPETAPAVEITLDGKNLTATGFPEPQDRHWLDQLLGEVSVRGP